MDKEKINRLFERYLDGTCTEEEKQVLELWFAQQSLKGNWVWENEEDKLATANKMHKHLKELMAGAAQPTSLNYRKLIKPIAIAASFLLVLSAACWFYYTNSETINLKAAKQSSFRNGLANETALLMLADGSHILLDSMANGVLYQVGQTVLRKIGPSELVYENSDKSKSFEALSGETNRLMVPRGRDFKLTMTDGTRVWINAASSLVYPITFTQNERCVSLNGEAYFEVAKNKSKPFKVKAKETEVYVMGTSFNINAYDDENKVITTLAEGKVQVASRFEKLELAPNEQAVNYTDRNRMDFYQVSADNALAWKNGYFVFDNQDITAIMKNVSRWYDIEVSYQGQVSKKRFGGTFSRTKSITELLNYLESLGNFRFKQKGRRIIVMS